jgi:hypothetical protein
VEPVLHATVGRGLGADDEREDLRRQLHDPSPLPAHHICANDRSASARRDRATSAPGLRRGRRGAPAAAHRRRSPCAWSASARGAWRPLPGTGSGSEGAPSAAAPACAWGCHRGTQRLIVAAWVARGGSRCAVPACMHARTTRRVACGHAAPDEPSAAVPPCGSTSRSSSFSFFSLSLLLFFTSLFVPGVEEG